MLLPCTSCRRHVRVEATTCPFCAGALALVAPAARTLPRLSRSAIVALGTTAILAGCGGDDGGQVAALYGVPPTDTGLAADTGATADTGTADTTTADTSTPADSGTDTGSTPDARDAASDARDGSTDTGDVGIAPPYGIPPSDGG